MSADDLLRQGDLDGAFAALKEQVRSKPADPALRVFLFQLLCIRGEWDKAMTQLNVAAELDPANLLMAQACRPALNCEAFRAGVFAGKRSPLVLGEPPEWIGRLIEASRLVADGKFDQAASHRDAAFELAEPVSGRIDGHGFGWLCDADTRLGPVFEAIVNGRYYWLPVHNVASISFDPPKDLRDAVWMPATLKFVNGGEVVALFPTRYPGSESADDPALRLARHTRFEDKPGDTVIGLGQRMFATDAGEYPIMSAHLIEFDVPAAEGPRGGVDG